MKKRIFALLLPLMMLFAFTACSDKGQTSSGSTANNASQQSGSTVAYTLLIIGRVVIGIDKRPAVLFFCG